jgi:hypothetical protein
MAAQFASSRDYDLLLAEDAAIMSEGATAPSPTDSTPAGQS